MGSEIATIVLIGLEWIVGLMVSLARPRGRQHVLTHAVRRNSGVTNRSGYSGWALPKDLVAGVGSCDRVEPVVSPRGRTRS